MVASGEEDELESDTLSVLSDSDPFEVQLCDTGYQSAPLQHLSGLPNSRPMLKLTNSSKGQADKGKAVEKGNATKVWG